MIIAVVPCPVYAKDNRTIIGRSDNSGLPDFMLYSSYAKTERALLPYIGSNITYTGVPLYKVYAIWSNIFYEYTVAKVMYPNSRGMQYVFVPISVKQYGDGYKTYVYLNGVQWLSGVFNRSDVEFKPVSFPVLLYNMACNSTNSGIDGEVLISKFKPTPYDHYLTMEAPNEISNILIEVGSDCYNYGGSALLYLYYNYGEDIMNLGRIFSIGLPEDLITKKGCSGDPVIGELEFKYKCDQASCSYFRSMLDAHFESLKRPGMPLSYPINYMDKQNPLYDDLDMNCLIDCLYCEQCTDISMNITCCDSLVAGHMFTDGHIVNPISVPGCILTIQSYMNTYNRGKTRQIIGIDILKTWLDELFIDIHYTQNEVEHWFISLGLYHLYSPSIIKENIAAVLQS